MAFMLAQSLSCTSLQNVPICTPFFDTKKSNAEEINENGVSCSWYELYPPQYLIYLIATFLLVRYYFFEVNLTFHFLGFFATQ